MEINRDLFVEISVMASEKLLADILAGAEKNLSPAFVKDLRRLIASVLFQKEYADVTEEEIKELMVEGKTESMEFAFDEEA